MNTERHCLGKERFGGADAARRALRGGKAGRETYRCPKCGGWHITSMRRSRYDHLTARKSRRRQYGT